MLSRHSTRACGALLLFGLLAFSVGCGTDYKARAIVKGNVTIAGKALTTGSVMFYGKNNLTASSRIDVNGNYVMNDAPLGEVTITVSVPKPPPGGLERMRGGAALKAVKDEKSTDPEGSGRSIPVMGTMPSHLVPIPEKYASVETSGLTYTVEKGEHTYDITLTK